MNVLYILSRIVAGIIGVAVALGIIGLIFVWLWWLILPFFGLVIAGFLIQWAFGN